MLILIKKNDKEPPKSKVAHVRISECKHLKTLNLFLQNAMFYIGLKKCL